MEKNLLKNKSGRSSDSGKAKPDISSKARNWYCGSRVGEVPQVKKVTGLCNCFFIDGEEKVLIDAGVDFRGHVDTIILTHCHYDHIAYLNDIVQRTGCRIFAPEKEAEDIETLSEKTMHENCAFDILPVKIDRKLKDKEVLDFINFRLEVVSSPGHTDGSICLFNPDSKELFSGDTFFDSNMFCTGRTDFISSSPEDLKKSIAKLKKMDFKKVYPGHDY